MRGWVTAVLVALVAAPASAGAAPSWTPPTKVSPTERDGRDPTVGVDAAGNVTAIWRHDDGTNYEVQAAVRLATTGGWSKPVDLSLPGRDAYDPRIAVNPAGQAVVVWQRFEGSTYRTQASVRSTATGTWSSPVNLSTDTDDAERPAVALDAAGNATAIWQQFDGSNTIAQTALGSVATGTWSPSLDLSAAGRNVNYPSVAVDLSGNATALWLRETATNAEVQTRVRHAGTTVWSPVERLSGTTFNADVPQLALGPGGSAAAMWIGNNGGDDLVQGAVRQTTDDAWTAPATISDAGVDALDPVVAIDSDLTVLAAWRSYTPLNYRVYGAARSILHGSSGTWSKPGNVSAPVEYASGLRIGADGTAIWEGLDGTRNRIRTAAWQRSTGTWAPPAEISSDAEDSSSPQLMLDAAGNRVAAWEQRTPATGPTRITLAAFDASPPVLPDGAFSVPATGVVGKPVVMNAVPYDVWSGVATTSWDFGDFAVNAATTSPPAFGGTQTYPAAHTYAHAGTYSVMVKITDGVGHTTFDARLITIAPAPPAAVVKPSAGTTTQAEALLAGKKITIAALMKRTPRAKRCPTKATATVKLKVSSRITITGRAKLKVKATKVNGQARCRATGTLKLSGAPATTAKVRVVIRGTGLKARTLTAAR